MGRLWIEDERLRLESGKVTKAIAPAIIAASRVTDIPAHYCDWFFHRLRAGYLAVRTPGSRKLVHRYVSFANTKFIVFFSKNPRPLIAHIPYLKEKNIDFYINYTLNDYSGLGLEPGLNVEEPLLRRIDTFKRLADTVGPERVVWHFDPLVYAPKIKVDTLMERISSIAEQLKGYTNRFMFGFLNVPRDSIVSSNLKAREIPFKPWTKALKLVMVQEIVKANKNWGFELATCSDADSYSLLGVKSGRCVDYKLITRLAWRNPYLMDTIGARIYNYDAQPSLFGDVDPLPDDAIMLDSSHYILPDDELKKNSNANPGENECRCNYSFDIGTTGTCTYKCAYCFAAEPSYRLDANVKAHYENPKAPTILGEEDEKLRVTVDNRNNPKGIQLDRSLHGLNSTKGDWDVETKLPEDDPYYILAKKVFFYAKVITEQMIDKMREMYPDPYSVLGIEPPKPSSSSDGQSVQRQKVDLESDEVKERIFRVQFNKNSFSFNNGVHESESSETEPSQTVDSKEGEVNKDAKSSKVEDSTRPFKAEDNTKSSKVADSIKSFNVEDATKPSKVEAVSNTSKTEEVTKASKADKGKKSSVGKRNASSKEVTSASSSVAPRLESIAEKGKDSSPDESSVSLSTGGKVSVKVNEPSDNQSNDSYKPSDKRKEDTTSVAVSDKVATSSGTVSSKKLISSDALFETEDKVSKFEYAKHYYEAIIHSDGEVIIDPEDESDPFARDIWIETESINVQQRQKAAQVARSQMDVKARGKSSRKNTSSKKTSSKKRKASATLFSEQTEVKGAKDSSLTTKDAVVGSTSICNEPNNVSAPTIKGNSADSKTPQTQSLHSNEDTSVLEQEPKVKDEGLSVNPEPTVIDEESSVKDKKTSVNGISSASTSIHSGDADAKEGLQVKDIFFPVIESQMQRGTPEPDTSQEATHKKFSDSGSTSKSELDPTNVQAYLQMLRDSGKYTSEEQVMEAFIQKVNSMNISGGDQLFNADSKKKRKRISSVIYSTVQNSDKDKGSGTVAQGKSSSNDGNGKSLDGTLNGNAESDSNQGTNASSNEASQYNPYSFLNKTYPTEPIKYDPNSDEAGSAYVTDYDDIQQQITKAEEESMLEAEQQKNQWLQRLVGSQEGYVSEDSGSEQRDVISDLNSFSDNQTVSLDNDMSLSVGMNRNTLRNKMKKKK